ncbi:hypothetical protein TH9_12320 [Thalassospira xiamenensis]|uniref:helix-turn-helix domain-containing protein n=1 Tax=Thalassospira xiamenensis TaxID=220697 RepID=UPI000DED613E|nr:helix-turn-helix domain-containing protein [Thalassospira xiamenensis]RCK32506.1 hypothetical protein TH9_12320 [Thalassospira xiamenensis]
MVKYRSRSGQDRDFLNKEAVPGGLGYRVAPVAKEKPAGRVTVKARRLEELNNGGCARLKTARIIFTGSETAGLIIAGPGGARSLTNHHAAILMTLCGKPGHHVCDWMYIAETVWPDPDDMPDYWREVLDVQICKLRKVLKSINSEISIVTRWGRGYSAQRGPYPDNDNEWEDIAARA